MTSANSVAELCRTFGISRKTGDKWITRYEKEGPSGLEDRSRAPHRIPHKTPPESVEFILDERTKHPTWGARKIAQVAVNQDFQLALPSETTMNHIIKENGMVQPRHKRAKVGHPGKPLVRAQGPNDIWTMDFKGEFRTLDGYYCFPLTVMDEYSRWVLACKGLLSTAHLGAFQGFRRLFREFGLPDAIKSDNGCPFASPGLARLSSLSVWFIKLGIVPILIEPGKPSQNGIHERMHRTLKAETTIPPGANLAAQQRRFNEWMLEYNQERPHQALDNDRPCDHYNPSPREFPSKLPEVEYPDHFEVRYVSANRCFRWKNHAIQTTSALIHENVGLEAVSDGLWAVYFSWKRIGFLDERKMRILDDLGQWVRREI